MIAFLIIFEDLLADESLNANVWKTHVEHLARVALTEGTGDVIRIVKRGLGQSKQGRRAAAKTVSAILDLVCRLMRRACLADQNPVHCRGFWRESRRSPLHRLKDEFGGSNAVGQRRTAAC